MLWVVLDIIGLTAETSLIVVLGRRATGDEDSTAPPAGGNGRQADQH